jgi:hypothetical protein
MPHPKPYPRCIYCGERANSRQHAIPAWLARRFGLKGLLLQAGSSTGLVYPIRQPVSFANHRGRITCAECNTFFKHLEDKVADTIEWMARGRSIRLDTEQVALIGIWGAKTGIELIAIHPDFRELVPQEHRRALRYQEQPHDDCWVGYCSWTGRYAKFVGHQGLGITDADGVERLHSCYSAVFTFEKLALKLTGLIDPAPGYGPSWDNQSLRQTWPPRHLSLDWPLFPAAGDANFNNLCMLPPFQKQSS